MSNYSKLYWLTRLDSIQGLFVGLTIFGFLVILISMIAYYFGKDMDECYSGKQLEDRINGRKPIMKYCKKYSFLPFVFLLFAIFVPNQKEMITIIAGGKTLNFIQSDTSINKIPSQTTAIISDFLQKQINNIKK